MSMTLVFTQILVILLYVLVGFVAGKAGLIKPDQRKYLTKLCSDLILPFTILSATSQELGSGGLAELGLATLMMFGLFAVTSAVMLLWHRVRRTDAAVRAATTGLVVYPNMTFLGLPLCQALFGQVAILYNACTIVVFNVFFFTLQYSLFTEKKIDLKNLITAPMISTIVLIIMLVAGLHFPAPVQTVMSNIGEMITPLSLMIIGVMMSENELMAVLKEKRAYVITLLRNLVLPVVAMLLLQLLPSSADIKLCILVYMSCPCAALPTIYAIQTNKEPELCARTMLMSTIFFAATLPAIIALGQIWFT